MIGPRSALFAPLDRVGLIVLDEEHDGAYKQGDVMPTYHARTVATQIAATQGAVVLLGSATPDLDTTYRARETQAIHLLELPERILRHRRNLEGQMSLPFHARYRPLGPGYEDVYAVDLPPVRVVDMRHELRVGNRSILSRLLQKEMARAALQSAYNLVMARAEKITDPALRQSFLERVPVNREILQEYVKREDVKREKPRFVSRFIPPSE